MAQPQSEWNVEFQRYIIPLWSAEHGRYYWQHYVEGRGWEFFDYAPVGWVPSSHNVPQVQHAVQARSPATQNVPQVQYSVQGRSRHRTDSAQTMTPSRTGPARYNGRGGMIHATYNPTNPQSSIEYETLDPSFRVRDSEFFEEGKVFSVLFTEAAGANAVNGLNPTDYNTNLSRVKYYEYVFTQVRRFIVTKRKREFCFAVPIFSYGNKGTTKHGVVPNEHAIAYSLGTEPRLVHGESVFKKAAIPIVMDADAVTLSTASRIYFAIHHPIQYNVKVQSVGYVHPDYLPLFLGYWNEENFDSRQDIDVTQNPNNTDSV